MISDHDDAAVHHGGFMGQSVSAWFVFVLLLVSIGAHAQPVRTWVSPLGEDTGICDRGDPCRTFGAAIDAVQAGGEVVVLESAGYGPVTIDKAVSIISPLGIFAAIAPTSGNAITIDPSLINAVIILRGLTLNGRGATNGIDHSGTGDLSGNRLYIDNIIVSGFTGRGINLTRQGSFSIRDSVVRENGAEGIIIDSVAIPPSEAAVQGVVVERNGSGLLIYNARVAVRDSVATSHDASSGFGVFDPNGILSIDHSQATQNTQGFHTTAGQLFVSNSVASMNTFGLLSQVNGILRVGHTTVTANGTGFAQMDTAVFESRGDNNVRGNTTNKSGTITDYLPE
jgi:hypothetical protein